jgi:hypothetical protein
MAVERILYASEVAAKTGDQSGCKNKIPLEHKVGAKTESLEC